MTALATPRSANFFTTFSRVRARASALCPALGKISISTCSLADAEHARRERQYAHFGHKPGCVCVAMAFATLALEWQLGLVAHELGHALAAHLGLEHTEEEANRIGSVLLGEKVTFKGPLRLEWAQKPRWW